MSNGNGKERKFDSACFWESKFDNPRPIGLIAPLCQEGKIYLSERTIAVAQLGMPLYGSVWGTKDRMAWTEEAEATVGKMRGGITLSIATQPYKKDDETEDAKSKRIFKMFNGKPTASKEQEAQLQGAIASLGVSDPLWLKEHTVSS